MTIAVKNHLPESKNCVYCASSVEITKEDNEFYEKISPSFAGQKFLIPLPKLCPDCRQMRRLSFRNERFLYKRRCDASGRDIISMYSPEKPYKVYDQKIWWSDEWDAMQYGREFDFTKSFTTQFRELMKEVPHPSMISSGCEQCEYTCFTLDSKQCYMSSGITVSKNILYSNYIRESDTLVDCSVTQESQHAYECIDCFRIYACQYCQTVNESRYCFFCTNCTHCAYCIACVGLEQKEYYYKNEYIGKERFEELLVNMRTYTGLQALKKDYKEFMVLFSARTLNIIGSEQVTGNNIVASKNCLACYDIKDCEDCKYVSFTPYARVAQDCVYTAPRGVEYAYDVCSTVGVMNSAFTFLFWYGSHSYYLLYCHNCVHCFGCVGLRDKSYCIFNKQYTKEEYEKQVAKIIVHMDEMGEWGEFFHPSLGPFGYNETVAHEYYPVMKDEKGIMRSETKSCETRNDETGVDISQLGYKRSDYESPKLISDKIIQGAELPERSDEVDESILQTAIKCEDSGKLFRLIPQELAFYRKHNIPLPRKHPDQRHLERLQLRKYSG